MITWSDFYLFCFAFGFLFSLVAFGLGHFSAADVGTDHGGGHFDADAHHADLDADQQGHPGHTHGPVSRHTASPINPGTVAVFLTWFGGTGYLATRLYSLWVFTTLALSLVTGVLGAAAVFWFLARVLMREREDLDPADYDMIGVLGIVSGAIRADGIGEVLFSQAGSRRAVPSRSDSGKAIPAGTEVVVTRYENGVAYVRGWEELTATDDGSAPTADGR